ncbi:hypothetical protein F1C15_03660 [Frigoribacterium sp. NBH87]|uniref:hypothetical protein n=1 Tax=Frigoribacterium sp. NBH87 TaxID=2596916 RepID=UPI001624E62A|nr:hypothetical protein [Frigoribacterium sp. NBH87]QNE43026.1 hypothetical protein F1C15_03660 [Frigoribacterium sp. NBH87]
MSDAPETPAPADATATDPVEAADEQAQFDAARLAAGEDVDGTATLSTASSAAAPEKAGTQDALDNAAREAAAPDPADVHVASDEYPERPRLGGITASDTQI